MNKTPSVGSSFLATEFDAVALEPTGRVEAYGGQGAHEAVQNILYTVKLRYDRSWVGPTGRVVHADGVNCSVTSF